MLILAKFTDLFEVVFGLVNPRIYQVLYWLYHCNFTNFFTKGSKYTIEFTVGTLPFDLPLVNLYFVSVKKNKTKQKQI